MRPIPASTYAPPMPLKALCEHVYDESDRTPTEVLFGDPGDDLEFPTPSDQHLETLHNTDHQFKTRLRVCRDCRTRKPEEDFPVDRYGRVDPRMSLQCVDENTPLLMTAEEKAAWLGVPISQIERETPVVGHYSPPRSKVVPLYGRHSVVDSLPPGWRKVFEWLPRGYE